MNFQLLGIQNQNDVQKFLSWESKGCGPLLPMLIRLGSGYKKSILIKKSNW